VLVLILAGIVFLLVTLLFVLNDDHITIVEPTSCTVFTETWVDTPITAFELELTAAYLDDADSAIETRETYNELADIDYDDDVIPLDSITPQDNEIF
jgi:hypothetical protein